MVKLLTWGNFLNAGVPFFSEVEKLCARNALEHVRILFFIAFVLSFGRFVDFEHFAIFIRFGRFYETCDVLSSEIWLQFDLFLDIVRNLLGLLLFVLPQRL